MSRELRIGAPGAGPAPDSPAFAISRDSGGILIGVRDNAAPQFAVSRDSDGLLLSAWPVAPAGPATLPTGFIKCSTDTGAVGFGFVSVRPVNGRTASVRSSVYTAKGPAANPHLVTAPTSIVTGDVLVMAVSTTGGWETGAPTGWTLVGQQVADGGNARNLSLYTRKATADDEGASSYAVPNGTLKYIEAYIYATADGLEVDFFASRFGPNGISTVVISADGFDAVVGSVFYVIGVNNLVAGWTPFTANNNPAWTQDVADTSWGAFYAWHAVWGA